MNDFGFARGQLYNLYDPFERLSRGPCILLEAPSSLSLPSLMDTPVLTSRGIRFVSAYELLVSELLLDA